MNPARENYVPPTEVVRGDLEYSITSADLGPVAGVLENLRDAHNQAYGAERARQGVLGEAGQR